MAMLTRGASVAPGSPKALQRFQNCIAFLWPSLQAQKTQGKSTQLDAIDCFTNELVYQKTRKWEDLRECLIKKNEGNVSTNSTATAAVAAANSSGSFSQNVGLLSQGVMNDLQQLRSPQLGLDIRSLSQAQLDNLLLSTLEIKNKLDFLYLIKQCIRWKQLPSNDVLISCLKYLSTLCRFQQIESFADICRAQGHALSKTYAGFAPFKAMALWRSGGADVALMTLQRGYGQSSESEEGRRMVRNAFRTIAEETLAQKSEAVLVSLMEVARSIYDEHHDIFVIACVWKQCFASDWFCDQKSATDLFENYKDLQQLVARRAGPLSASFLGRNNVDAVHRLIEVFLHYKEKEACASCLSMLFNYQYLRKDLRACAEIIKSCSELGLPLSEVQNEQFLTLFLNHTGAPLDSRKNSATRINVAHRTQKPTTEFQYKF